MFGESWGPQQHPLQWQFRAGGGAVHSIKSGLMHRSKVAYDHGQITPPPLGFLKQPTDCGSTCLGSQSTISGKKMIKTIVIRKTT
jgi:hypothetical protein